jgi:hypothetical protein
MDYDYSDYPEYYDSSDVALLKIAVDLYPWPIETWLDEWAALSIYFRDIAPLDQLIEKIELGSETPNSLRGLKNFRRKN